MRSAFAKRRQGDQDWMIKFDGVGDPDRPDPESQPYNRIEYAYSLMAREAGIEMAETHLLEERGLAHFMTRRFDRDGDTRLHMHSLGGMEQVDYNLPGAYSYEQFFRLLLELGLGNPTLEQAFLRVAFNILTVNQDDHVKNIAFLMDPAGQWRLSPAYDLTYARGQGYTLHHQMSLANKRDDFTLQDLSDFASKFGIRHAGRPLLDQLTEALSHWPTHASAAGLTAARAQLLQSAFRC
jgi:serine/threonine-protein kinase HipA